MKRLKLDRDSYSCMCSKKEREEEEGGGRERRKYFTSHRMKVRKWHVRYKFIDYRDIGLFAFNRCNIFIYNILLYTFITLFHIERVSTNINAFICINSASTANEYSDLIHICA